MVGCDVAPSDIEAYHGLFHTDRVIAMFLRRKDCHQIVSLKEVLRGVMEDVALAGI